MGNLSAYDRSSVPELKPERQALLSQTLGRLLLAEDPDRIIRELFPQVAQHLNVDTYFNYMVREPGKTLELHSYAGIPESTARSIIHLRFGDAICGTVAQQRHGIVAEDIQHSTYDKAALVRGLGIQCYACNPLLVGDELMGTLSFASRTRTHFDAEELAFIQAVTHYTAIAMFRLRTQRQLREKAEVLSAMDARKNAFISGLGHELRDPLMPLSNSLHVLRMPDASEQDKEQMMSVMERQMRQLVRLVDDLLDVSRVATGRLELRHQQVDLRSSIRIAVEMSQAQLERLRTGLELHLMDEPCMVSGDPARLAQIFTNLFSYIARTSDRGDHVQVGMERSGDQAEVIVHCAGMHLKPALLAQIFDLFKRAEAGPDRSREGLGVGLALAKHLAHAHGGDLIAETTETGARFRVVLPLLKAAAA